MTAAPAIALNERFCPVCAMPTPCTVVRAANYDFSKLTPYAFASRKFPEHMHFRLLRCRRCDLLFANPIPPAAALLTLYREAAYDSQAEAEQASRTYAGLLQKNLNRLPDLATALDIGAGDGAFLERLREIGFAEITGVEPSLAPVQAANAAIRPLLRHSAFRAEDFAPGSFSLISCFQTLEHLPDPGATARQIYSLLKPGGMFFCIAHNCRALTNAIMGRRSPIYDIEHLQLYSPASIRALFTTAGFAGVQVQSIVNTYPLRYWLRLGPWPRRVAEQVIALAGRIGLADRLVSLPAGNMAIMGRRPGER